MNLFIGLAFCFGNDKGSDQSGHFNGLWCVSAFIVHITFIFRGRFDLVVEL